VQTDIAATENVTMLLTEAIEQSKTVETEPITTTSEETSTGYDRDSDLEVHIKAGLPGITRMTSVRLRMNRQTSPMLDGTPNHVRVP
jgi:hypothetical protein